MAELSFRSPLTFEPLVLAKPWGGGSRIRRLGIPVPTDPPTGEVWLVSDVDGRPSVVDHGPLAGRTLGDLVRDHSAAILGRSAPPEGAARFPLLVKLVEVEGRLSVQVHPDAEVARKNGDGPLGKFEAWAVLESDPRARASVGLDRRLSRDEVRALVAAGRLEERLNTFAPSLGDAYVMTPGTIHTAGGGVLVLEVQESADVTYRLYDWGARGLDGKPRELHVEKALACADLTPRPKGAPSAPAPRALGPGVRARSVVSEGAGPFMFELVELAPGARLELGGADLPWVFVGLEGSLELAGAPFLEAGRAALWPASLVPGEVHAPGGARLARARPIAAAKP